MRLVLILIFTALPRLVAAQACDNSALVITNVGVWTPDGLLSSRDVTIDGGRVTTVEPASGKARPGRVIDGRGHTLLPGLIDTHLHFTVPGGLPAANGPRTDRDRITTRQVLLSGVTSGRLHLSSLENAIALKKQSQDPCAPSPRLQVGGPGLGGAAQKDSSAFMGASSVEDAIEKVRRFAAAGVDWLAVHDAHRFQPGVLAAIAATARQAGVRLMAAGGSPEEIRAALSMQPDTLDYFDRTEASAYDEALLAEIRSRKLILAPTVGVTWRMARYHERPERLADASNFRGFADADRDFVLGNARKELDGAEMKRSISVAPTIPNKLKQLHALRMPMAIATDAGSTMQFQPNAIWWELETWRSAGIASRDVLVAATVGGARVLGLEDVGHLRPGARGDFVLYRGNVEEGPFDGARVIAVGRGGIIFQ